MTVRKKPTVVERLDMKNRLPVMERRAVEETLILGVTGSQGENDCHGKTQHEEEAASNGETDSQRELTSRRA